MTTAAARDALFGDALSCDEARPVAVLPEWPDDARRRALVARAETLVRALALIEDSRAEDPEDHGPAADAIRRVEAKVDLLVGLVAALVQRDIPADPTRALQWSERGLAVELPFADASGFVQDAPAVVRIGLSDALPQPLVLPVTVLAIEPVPAGRRLWLRFDDLSPTLESLLGRHLFRVHRRAVAESRRQR